MQDRTPCPITGTDLLFIAGFFVLIGLSYLTQYLTLVKKKSWPAYLRRPLNAVETTYFVCTMAYLIWRFALNY